MILQVLSYTGKIDQSFDLSGIQNIFRSNARVLEKQWSAGGRCGKNDLTFCFDCEYLLAVPISSLDADRMLSFVLLGAGEVYLCNTTQSQ